VQPPLFSLRELYEALDQQRESGGLDVLRFDTARLYAAVEAERKYRGRLHPNRARIDRSIRVHLC